MKRALWILLLLAACLVAVFVIRKNDISPEKDLQYVKAGIPLPSPPSLLPARAATPDSPLLSWERLLVEDGSPVEDRAALQEIVTGFLQSTNIGSRPPLGPNEEFASALTDSERIGETAIPLTHPAIRDGKIIDRWGSPWFFHQESSGSVSVRSAGPDRRLFTSDDITD